MAWRDFDWVGCIAPAAVCDVINRIRGPFNTALLQQLAGVAAVEDRMHYETSVAHNSRWLPWITAEIRKTGLRVDDSVGNFVLIHFPKTGKTAQAADTFLSHNGIILRSVASYGLPDCLRMSVGTQEQNELAVKLIADFMAA